MTIFNIKINLATTILAGALLTAIATFNPVSASDTRDQESEAWQKVATSFQTRGLENLESLSARCTLLQQRYADDDSFPHGYPDPRFNAVVEIVNKANQDVADLKVIEDSEGLKTLVIITGGCSFVRYLTDIKSLFASTPTDYPEGPSALCDGEMRVLLSSIFHHTITTLSGLLDDFLSVQDQYS